MSVDKEEEEKEKGTSSSFWNHQSCRGSDLTPFLFGAGVAQEHLICFFEYLIQFFKMFCGCSVAIRPVDGSIKCYPVLSTPKPHFRS